MNPWDVEPDANELKSCFDVQLLPTLNQQMIKKLLMSKTCLVYIK